MMKLRNSYTYYLVLFIFMAQLLSSCTISRMRYNRGFNLGLNTGSRTGEDEKKEEETDNTETAESDLPAAEEDSAESDPVIQDRKFGLTLQLSTPQQDNIRLGWFDIDNESTDGHNLKHSAYAAGLALNYNLGREAMLRLRLGITRYSIEEYMNGLSASTDVAVSTTGKQNIFHAAPGIIWNIKTKNRFSIYGGFEVPANRHGVFTLVNSNTHTDNGSLVYQKTITTTVPKGYSLGLGALMGFSYFTSDCFSVHAEFASSMLYAKLAGETKTTNEQTVPVSSSSTTYTQDEDKGFTYKSQRFSLGISVWFR